MEGKRLAKAAELLTHIGSDHASADKIHFLISVQLVFHAVHNFRNLLKGGIESFVLTLTQHLPQCGH